MLTTDALAYYETLEKLAQAAGVTVPEVQEWRHFVPLAIARKLNRASRNEIPRIRPLWMRIELLHKIVIWYQKREKRNAKTKK